MAIEIPVGHGKFAGIVTVVDESDEPLVLDTPTRWRIYLSPRKSSEPVPYVFRNRPKTVGSSERFHIQLHRLILDAPDGVMVDHKNGNTLDNRRSNLRLATNSQNQANRVNQSRKNPHSRFKGVTWNKQCGKWQAGIKVSGRSIHLGLFADEVAAANAYNHAALQMFGEFAAINEIGVQA